jgi:hypothetical protein
MACLFLESFDKYGVPNANGATNTAPTTAHLVAQGDWTSATTGTQSTIVTGLSATGGAISLGGCTLSKTLSGNYPRLIGGVRFAASLGAVVGMQFNDNVTAQCGIMINNGTGTISLKNGTYSSGTIIATSTASVSANSTHYLEWDLTFSNTGAYQVWLDGLSILSGTADLTTTANNYANVYQLSSGGGTNTLVCDDLYLFDATGTRNNAALLTNPRIETTFPISDNTVQFAFGAASLGASAPRNNGSINATANFWYVRPLTPTQNCTLVSLTVLPGTTSGTINLRPVVYADNAGAPGTLLTTGATATGMTLAVPLLLNLTSAQSLTAGTQYWIGFMSDIALTTMIAGVDGLQLGRSATVTFTSGAPSTAPASSSGITTLDIWGNITGTTTNTYCVSGVNVGEPPAGPPLPNQSYVSDATVGHEDLYNFGSLSSTPTNIYAVAVKAYCARSDSGARTVSMRLKSGPTDSAGTLPGQSPANTYGWLASYFETDPNGSVAWSPSALNAASSGLRIDS